MADASGTSVPDSSGNGYNGTFGTGSAPYYGGAPTITSTGLLFNNGQAYNSCALFTSNPASFNGAVTVIVYYQRLNIPDTYGGILITTTAAYVPTIFARPGDQSIGIADSSEDTPDIVGASQPWLGVVPATMVLSSTPVIYYQGTPVSGYTIKNAASAIVGNTQTLVGGAPISAACFIGNEVNFNERS
jgi:hypothetical protein